MSDTEAVGTVEPYYGYRIWRPQRLLKPILKLEVPEDVLNATTDGAALMPLNDYGGAWPCDKNGAIPFEAKCWAYYRKRRMRDGIIISTGHEEHDVPNFDCTCGIWAKSELVGAEVMMRQNHIIGRIKGYGTVIECHGNSWRAQFAEILALYEHPEYSEWQSRMTRMAANTYKVPIIDLEGDTDYVNILP